MVSAAATSAALGPLTTGGVASAAGGGAGERRRDAGVFGLEICGEWREVLGDAGEEGGEDGVVEVGWGPVEMGSICWSQG